ncbi:MAG: hypothetical protein AABW50_02540 [Nanoarchaeota archaeon]
MPEEETIFSSKIKYTGIYSFKEFYKFCYDWLVDEMDLLVQETKYKEKLEGDAKNVEAEWIAVRKITDYFKFVVKINYKADRLKEIEINKGGAKIKTNQGSIEVGVKGMLVRDWGGKFERSGFQKFIRSVYEKWVIQSRVNEFEDRLVGKCSEFLEQGKAWLDLEGKQT